MDTNQKINLLFQALQLREESVNEKGERFTVVTVTGEDRTKLVAELVSLLTEVK